MSSHKKDPVDTAPGLQHEPGIKWLLPLSLYQAKLTEYDVPDQQS
jgi:hypothetical protein